MILRLDPRIPMVWRDPFSLQFGIEPAIVILRDVSSAHERLISTLSVGISPSGYEMVAESVGATQHDARALLDQLDPVLTARTGSAAPFSVEIVGQGPTAERIARALAQSGCHVRVASTVGIDDPAPQLGIAVGHYVFDPAVYSHWLRRDIPHLPVVFADGAVTVGPVVDPGRTACLHCIEFYRRDADSRWSTLAAQLWGRQSSAETPLVSREAATRAARMALQRLTADPGAAQSSSAPSFRIDSESGLVERTEWLPHPDCGCVSMAGDAGDQRAAAGITGVLRGIDSALSKRRTAFPPPPTRARVADAPA